MTHSLASLMLLFVVFLPLFHVPRWFILKKLVTDSTPTHLFGVLFVTSALQASVLILSQLLSPYFPLFAPIFETMFLKEKQLPEAGVAPSALFAYLHF